MIKTPVVVLDSDASRCRELCAVLKDGGYHATGFQALPDLQKYIRGRDRIAVILDLDTVPLDNRTIRSLAIENPGIYLLGLSKERFHPELKDAICYHIFACINKCTDPAELFNELFYWLNTIDQNEVEPKCPSG